MTDKTSMTCREVDEFLFEYSSGDLRSDERERFEAHVADCGPCLTYLQQYRDAIRLSQEALREPETTPPPELVRAVLAARKRR